MLSTDLGACEWFVWDLRRSNLIDRGQLDQVIGEFLGRHPGAEPPALAEYLIAKGVLTQFQADRLLQGKTQGFVLGPYTLMDALGTGSMGTVYKAQSKNDNRWYAVKVLPRRSMWNVRIARRKVRAFEQCQHPAVVPFLDVGTSGGMHYLAWPMVEGETLENLVKRQEKLPAAQAAQFCLAAAEGLEACHQQGLFHGQLKPSNLMIGPDQQVYLLDLGIGCLLAETEGESLVDTMSTANSVASGLDCSSPESIMDPTNLTPVGDQYSLGCVLYFCLTGRYPFPDGTAVEKMMAHQTKQPSSVKELEPSVPEELVVVVERLMQKAPENRFASMAEVVEALTPFAGPRPSRRPAPRSPEPVREVRSDRQHDDEPSAPEPARPQPRSSGASRGVGALPTRQSLQKGAASPPPTVEEPPVAPRRPVVPEPHSEAEAPRTWQERLGTVGIIAITVAVCLLVFLLTRGLF